MSKVWNDLKRELWSKPFVSCKICRTNEAVHLHHAIISKGKLRDRKKHKYIDHKCNALEVCNECHRSADAYETRRLAYFINAVRYGEEFDDWYRELPLKIKESFEPDHQKTFLSTSEDHFNLHEADDQERGV